MLIFIHFYFILNLFQLLMTNFLGLAAAVASKESAIAYLQEWQIIHPERKCPSGHAMTLCISEKEDRWRCRHSACNCQFQLKSGTWLEGAHITYTTATLFVYCWAHELSTVSFCSRELGIGSGHTIVEWNMKLREICAEKLLSYPVAIGGEGDTRRNRRKHVRPEESQCRASSRRSVGVWWDMPGNSWMFPCRSSGSDEWDASKHDLQLHQARNNHHQRLLARVSGHSRDSRQALFTRHSKSLAKLHRSCLRGLHKSRWRNVGTCKIEI